MADEISSSNITVGGFPTDGGVCFTAFDPAAKLPTDSTTALDATMLSLGDLSEDGFKETNELDMTEFKDCRGVVVLTSKNSEKHTIAMTFIEAMRDTVQQLVYGKDNVTIDAATKEITKVTVKPHDEIEAPLVVEQLFTNKGVAMKVRRVYLRTKISKHDDLTGSSKELYGFGLTFDIMEKDGIYGYIYYAKEA